MAQKFTGIWRKLHAGALASIDNPTEADRRLVDRFVENLEVAATAAEDAKAEPYVKGSTGQMTEHPGFKVAARCDAQALSLARQLKLTPFVRENYAADDDEAEESDDPIQKARDDLAARRAARAA